MIIDNDFIGIEKILIPDLGFIFILLETKELLTRFAVYE